VANDGSSASALRPKDQTLYTVVVGPKLKDFVYVALTYRAGNLIIGPVNLKLPLNASQFCEPLLHTPTHFI